MYRPLSHIDVFSAIDSGNCQKVLIGDDYIYEPPKDLCSTPISNDEYDSVLNNFRADSVFNRLPLSAYIYENDPIFAETRQQLALTNLQFAEQIQRAQEKKDLSLEKLALEQKIKKLKTLAKKNKALRLAKTRLLEISRRQTELELEEENIQIINTSSNIDEQPSHNSLWRISNGERTDGFYGEGGEDETKTPDL